MQTASRWPRHAHGEVQQAHRRSGLLILMSTGFIAAHTGEMIDIAGFLSGPTTGDGSAGWLGSSLGGR